MKLANQTLYFPIYSKKIAEKPDEWQDSLL